MNALLKNKLSLGLIAGSVVAIVILIVVLVMKKRENFSNLTEEMIQGKINYKIKTLNNFIINYKPDGRIKNLMILKKKVDIDIETTRLYYKMITNKESKIIPFLRFINLNFYNEALMEASGKNINSNEKAKVYEKITEDIKKLLKKINEIINSSKEEPKNKEKLVSLDALYTPNPLAEYNKLLFGAKKAINKHLENEKKKEILTSKKAIFSLIMEKISGEVDNLTPKQTTTGNETTGNETTGNETTGNEATPVKEPVVKPVVEQVIEPVVVPVVEQVIEPVVEPVVEQVIEPVVVPVVEQVVETKPNLVMNQDTSSNTTKIPNFEEGISTSTLANNSGTVTTSSQPVNSPQTAYAVLKDDKTAIINGQTYVQVTQQPEIVM